MECNIECRVWSVKCIVLGVVCKELRVECGVSGVKCEVYNDVKCSVKCKV